MTSTPKKVTDVVTQKPNKESSTLPCFGLVESRRKLRTVFSVCFCMFRSSTFRNMRFFTVGKDDKSDWTSHQEVLSLCVSSGLNERHHRANVCITWHTLPTEKLMSNKYVCVCAHIYIYIYVYRLYIHTYINSCTYTYSWWYLRTTNEGNCHCIRWSHTESECPSLRIQHLPGTPTAVVSDWRWLHPQCGAW